MAIDLLAPFQPSHAEKIGIEVECGAVDPETGRSVPYETVYGILEGACATLGGTPSWEEDALTGVLLPGGARLCLEPGGAIEYASAPAAEVCGVVAQTHQTLGRLAEIAADHGAALLNGAFLPFETLQDAHWVPTTRNRLMLAHYARTGTYGQASMGMSALAISTQATFDYLSDEDLNRQLRMQMAVSPIVAAMFVNSPLVAGRLTGESSRRLRLLLGEDPSRFGYPPFAMSESISAQDWAGWVLGLPMVYRRTPGGYAKAPDAPFRELLRRGFDDGSMPTESDWHMQLSQVFTHVRLRETLEVRLDDGPPHPYIGAVPAFWAGLTYHPASRDAAWALARGRTLADQLQLIADVAREGLAAEAGGQSVRHLAAELLDLSRQGLEARVARGLEQPAVLDLLTPLTQIVSSGRTFADRLAEHWTGALDQRADRYVEAYRVGSPFRSF
ncbi:MAG: hypothetical protein JWO67_436 [Streptosporangiaceae bacterium]|nr:hypothetical protein [Streptosporangiaceae bacterium]